MTVWLGELSMCIYITTAPVLSYFQTLYGKQDALWIHKFIFLGVSIFTPIIFMALVKNFYFLIPKVMGKLRD